MQTLYLIRHTAPDIAPGVCYGQLDIGLAASFADEARQVLAWLPPVELVVTSPLRRARILAEYLAQHRNCGLDTDARLMEKNFGAWEGRPWDAIERAELDAWAADVAGYVPRGGESAAQLAQRVRALLRDLAALPQCTIALSTHGGVIRTVLAEAAGVQVADILRWEIAYGTAIGVRLGTR